MNVLSVCDGISCGRVALERAGISINKYYASEIDKYAIQITQKNYPNTIQLGDITKWQEWEIDWSSIDLLIGGTPCQGFSFAGKQLNFNDPRSKLFFVYVDILNHIKKHNPNVKFLLENVKMKKEYQDVISSYLKVEPVEINSALVSAQNRKRLYWTNVGQIEQPEDKGILLKDIVHEKADTILETNMSSFNINPSGKGMNGEVYPVTNNKSRTITTNKGEGPKISVPLKEHVFLNVPEATKKGYTEIAVGQGVDLTFINSNTRRGRKMEQKSNCLTATRYEYGILESLKEYIVPFDKTLQILEKEVERGKVGFFRKDNQSNRVYFIHNKAVTLCGDAGGGAAKMGQYLFGCITPDRIIQRQNGQRFNEGQKSYTLTTADKHGVLIEGYIRKLTPIECERLQTLPDNYTEGVSNSQRYKCLGNGWTVDVIAHIFKYLKEVK